jgi:single-stranded DNA-binding protein
MIDALIAGRMFGHAEERTGQSDSTYVTCKVRTAAGNADSLFCNVIAFQDDVRRALLALDDGDSVALSGALTPKVWIDKQGKAQPALDLVAHAVISAYHVARKRAAVAGRAPAEGAPDHGGADHERA